MPKYRIDHPHPRFSTAGWIIEADSPEEAERRFKTYIARVQRHKRSQIWIDSDGEANSEKFYSAVARLLRKLTVKEI